MHRRAFLAAAPFSLFGSGSFSESAKKVEPILGPFVDRLTTDDGFRAEFVEYVEDRLGTPKFKKLLFDLLLDAVPELRSRPMMMRTLEHGIHSDAPPRGIFRQEAPTR